MSILKTWREAGKKTFSVILGGDFCPREENSSFVAENAEQIVSGVKTVFKKDAVKIIQWECAVTEGGQPIIKSGPCHRCTESVLNAASVLDIDVALLANNHTGDYGPSEVMTTIENIRARGIKTVGAGINREAAAEPLFIEKNGVQLAIINICENEFGGAGKNKAGTNTMDPLENLEQIRAVRKKADVVIVTVHGGHENYAYPSRRMIRLYRAFAEAGADAVWNCHTHCPCGFEEWKGVPVIYSPGNFYFPRRPYSVPSWNTGYITEFLCDEYGIYGYELTPYGFTREKMFLLEGETCRKAEAYLKEISEPLADMEKIDALFDSWCTKAGISYISLANQTREEVWPPADWSDPEVIARWMAIRNLFTCESHTYLIQNTARLIEEGRVAEAAAGLADVKKRQNPDFVTW